MHVFCFSSTVRELCWVALKDCCVQVHIKGTWVTIPPKPGHLIINLGDLLHRCDASLCSQCVKHSMDSMALHAASNGACCCLRTWLLQQTKHDKAASPHIAQMTSVQGSVLHRWTNGAYVSALHRVVSTSGKHRYSTGACNPETSSIWHACLCRTTCNACGMLSDSLRFMGAC